MNYNNKLVVELSLVLEIRNGCIVVNVCIYLLNVFVVFYYYFVFFIIKILPTTIKAQPINQVPLKYSLKNKLLSAAVRMKLADMFSNEVLALELPKESALENIVHINAFKMNVDEKNIILNAIDLFSSATTDSFADNDAVAAMEPATIA